MANNVVEEFAIAFGFDTAGVKKQAKEIDKILDNLVTKKRKGISQEAKERNLAYKQRRKDESDNMQFILKQEKARVSAEGRVADAVRKEQDRFNKAADRVRMSPGFRKISDPHKRRDIESKIQAAVRSRNIRDLQRIQQEIKGVARETRKLNVVQKGLNDSTRNMVRSYASVFALFQGTVAIKRVGQDFQGMDAAMLAASGSSEAAAKDLAFVSDVVDEMGLNLKDSTDAYVKLKFALKGKLDDGQIEDLFENVSKFGTALKIAPEDMKRAQRALIQMGSKGKIMAKFFGPSLRN